MGTDDGTDLPRLGAPACRALLGAGYRRLDQLAEAQESELLKLHGIGPKAMTILRAALEDRDLSFRDG